jgi:hypothetical protein
MDGRWHVGLDICLRIGIGPPSRHDQQGIHQVIACSRATVKWPVKEQGKTNASQFIHGKTSNRG